MSVRSITNALSSVNFVDPKDQSKKFTFVTSELSKETVRQVTIPDDDIVVLGESNEAEITNKVLNGNKNTFLNIHPESLNRGINAQKLGEGTVDNKELGFLDGVVRPLQEQLDELHAHAKGDGSDHTFIDQDVTKAASPSFESLKIGNLKLESDTVRFVGSDLRLETTKGNRISVSGDPTDPLHIATKQYVDAVATGLDFKNSVKLATSELLDGYLEEEGLLIGEKSGKLVVDGKDAKKDSRILIAHAKNPVHNGIYVVLEEGSEDQAWELRRSEDANDEAEVSPGMYTFVERGAKNKASAYVLATTGNVKVGETPLNFVKFSGAADFEIINLGEGKGLFKKKHGDELQFLSVVGSKALSVKEDPQSLILDVLPKGIQILELDGAPKSQVVGVDDKQLLSNKTIDGAENVLRNIPAEALADGSISNKELKLLDGLNENVQERLDTLQKENSTTSEDSKWKKLIVQKTEPGKVYALDGVVVGKSEKQCGAFFLKRLHRNVEGKVEEISKDHLFMKDGDMDIRVTSSGSDIVVEGKSEGLTEWKSSYKFTSV